jgi:hypothetical protein
MRKAARANVWRRFLPRLNKMERKKVITMIVARITEIPPPAMKV